MPDDDLSGLSTRSFEKLIQAMAARVLGPGTVTFGDGPDEGREATFEGRMDYLSPDGIVDSTLSVRLREGAMRRTQIGLNNREYDFVRHEARRRRTTIAAVIRELIHDRMVNKRQVAPDHPLRDIIGLGRGDGSPVSEKHDQFLYGPAERLR